MYLKFIYACIDFMVSAKSSYGFCCIMDINIYIYIMDINTYRTHHEVPMLNSIGGFFV